MQWISVDFYLYFCWISSCICTGFPVVFVLDVQLYTGPHNPLYNLKWTACSCRRHHEQQQQQQCPKHTGPVFHKSRRGGVSPPGSYRTDLAQSLCNVYITVFTKSLQPHNLTGKLVLCRSVTKSVLGTLSSIAKQRIAQPFSQFLQSLFSLTNPNSSLDFHKSCRRGGVTKDQSILITALIFALNKHKCTQFQFWIQEKIQVELCNSSAVFLSFYCKPSSI